MVKLFSLYYSSLVTLAAWANASPMLKAVQVTAYDAAASLRSQLSRGADAEEEALARLEKELKATFAALPKSANGTLSHATVRYTLHRFFVQRYGWFIRGLEPHGSQKGNTEEWVPEYLQALIERREKELGESGTSLPELAALAAALEDLVSREAGKRMEAAWRIQELEPDEEVTFPVMMQAVETFYVAFLNGGTFTANSAWEASIKKLQFAHKYAGWDEAMEFLNATLASYFKKGPYNLELASRAVPELGHRYHTLNDKECVDLKATLRGMEGSQAGRVRLPHFYKKALYSHWRFDEKAEYLRALGALDESDPKHPKVITVNYVMARNNCLEASGLYAICCRNECEDLMGHLESQISAPEAEPHQIAELVANLSSDTVQAPRNLSASLLDRLMQVAMANNGKVPLHGRLFAQWMHHAYPRECPYPHEAGTINPQTPDEWMRATGHGQTSVSEPEMQAEVERDTCAVGAAGEVLNDCGGSSDLPWSEAEELLSPAVAQEEQAAPVEAEPAARSTLERNLWVLFTVALLVTGGVAVHVLGRQQLSKYPAAGVVYVSLLAWTMGLLDTAIFACAALGGSASVLVRVVALRTKAATAATVLPFVEPKCSV